MHHTSHCLVLLDPVSICLAAAASRVNRCGSCICISDYINHPLVVLNPSNRLQQPSLDQKHAQSARKKLAPRRVQCTREQFVLTRKWWTYWHSLSTPINTLYHDILEGHFHDGTRHHVSFTCHSHMYTKEALMQTIQLSLQTKKLRKLECDVFTLSARRGMNKRPRFRRTILLAGYFWCPGGGEGWKSGHKGKNVVPVVVLEGHGRVDVGVGCLPFHIGWPWGCMSQGLPVGGGVKWVEKGCLKARGQQNDLCNENRMI